MRLLLDHNLSRRMTKALGALFPGTLHVSDVGLERASDETVWAFARREDAVIVTKDADFIDLATLRGAPPKVL